MRRLRAAALVFAAATAGCGGLDKILEGSQPSEARIKLSLAATEVVVAAGRDTAIAATVTRTLDFTGAVALDVQGLPQGVTATVLGSNATGHVTSAEVTLRVAATAVSGRYPLLLRGRSPKIPVDGVAPLVLFVAPAPLFAVELSRTALVIARGGIAPVGIHLARTNLGEPVTLSLQGAPQLSAAFSTNPVQGDTTTMTLSVAADTPPGDYQANLRASAPGALDRTVPIAVAVTADPLQLVVAPTVQTAQGSVTSVGVVINRPGVTGDVALSAESLPPGITAAFDAATLAGTTTALRLTILPTVPADIYPLRLRARANGLPDATTEFQLRVTPSALALALVPGSATVYQGSGTTVSIALTRLALPAPVTLTAVNLPAGVTATANPGSTNGSLASLVIQASTATPPGTYPITVQAVPGSWPAGALLEAILQLTVRPQFPTSNGNLRLDWSGCEAPSWIATSQGYGGSWFRFTPVNGRVQLPAASAAGVAWVENGNTVTVQWLAGTDVPAEPVDMCPPPPAPPGKTITGTAVHFSNSEEFRFSMGGVTTTTTADFSTITLQGVPDGAQDLVGWGEVSIGIGLRGLLRRGVMLSDGGSLGPVDLTGPESFAPVRPTLSVTGGTVGESVVHSMAYATGVACLPNPMYSDIFGAPVAMGGVPPAVQLDADYHLLTVTATSGTRVRTVNVSSHALVNTAVVLPPLTGAITVTSLGAGYKRLQLRLGSLPGAYNGVTTFRYTDGVRTMVMKASSTWIRTSGLVMAMPDFTGVPGWSAGLGIPASAAGNWTLTTAGATPGAVCSEGRTALSLAQQGSF